MQFLDLDVRGPCTPCLALVAAFRDLVAGLQSRAAVETPIGWFEVDVGAIRVFGDAGG